MASTDARIHPPKNTAYRATFPVFDSTGSLVTGAAGLDSEVSKDAGTFADCTNEAIEIATASGVYYLDLTSTEMNADTVAVIVKSSTTGAKTTVLVMYPQEAGDIKVDVETIKTQAVTCAAGVTVLASVGTAATSTAQTGDSFARIGAPAGASIAADLVTIDDFLDTEVGAIKAVTDNLATAIELDGAVYRFTVNALELAPTGGSAPTANQNADALLDRVDGIETGITLRQAQRLIAAACAGQVSGAATTTVVIKAANNSGTTRVTALVDVSGNRSSVTLNP